MTNSTIRVSLIDAALTALTEKNPMAVKTKLAKLIQSMDHDHPANRIALTYDHLKKAQTRARAQDEANGCIALAQSLPLVQIPGEELEQVERQIGSNGTEDQSQSQLKNADDELSHVLPSSSTGCETGVV